MQKKSVLIITPFFAPQTHAAVFRAYKLAKYLPELGWEVHILTTDTNYLYNEDPALLNNLPASVKIHRARYVEPTLRGLRMALGGKDRSFKKLKSQNFSPTLPSAVNEFKVSKLKRIYQYLLAKINCPDTYWTWKSPAIKLATKVIKDYQISVVMTSSPPFTTLEIGKSLKTQLNVRWIADYRDPMVADCRNHSNDPGIFLRQYLIEKDSVNFADAVVTASTAQKLIMTDQYGVEKSRRIVPILTGVDAALIQDTAPSEKTDPYLIFVGEYLSQYGDEFFKIFKDVLSDPQITGLNLKLKILGVRALNEPRILPILKALKIESHVEFIDHLPQQEVYKIVQKSLGGVLCSSRAYPWWTAYSKVADYVALNKAVVAVVPDPSEARKWLGLTGLGVFLDGTQDECTKKLRNFILSPEKPTAVDEQRQKFFVNFQVKEFENIFLGNLKGHE